MTAELLGPLPWSHDFRVVKDATGGRVFHAEWFTKSELEKFLNWINAAPSREAQARAEGERAGIERAATFAESWLNDWGSDLAGTRDDYISARSSGVFAGRRIKPDDAKSHARDFGIRADAVSDCADSLGDAIRSLKVEGE